MCSGGLLKLDNLLGKAPGAALDPTRILHKKRLSEEKKNKQKRIDDNAAELATDENASQDVANLELAAARRRRRLSSLLVGGRSVLGAPAGRGAAAGAGVPGGGSGGASYAGGGSTMARGGAYGAPSRSYGGAARF